MLLINTALEQVIDPHKLAERIAGQAVNDDYIDGVDKLVRFADPRELRAPYRAKPFEDRRCPICGNFVCGGC
jgi:hypothetical protein